MSLISLFACEQGRRAMLAGLEHDLRRGLGTVERAPLSAERDRAIAILESASRYAHELQEHGDAWSYRPEDHDGERCFALVLSAREAAHERRGLAAKSLLETAPDEDGDPGWLGVLWSWLARPRADFRRRPSEASGPRAFADDAVIALTSDWGTGNASSARIADLIRDMDVPHSIHLGDVYYSGTETEVREKLVHGWPAGSVSSFTLNANQEMVSGGYGYFDVALGARTFSAQDGFSYFALANRYATVVGVDTAYHARRGSLGERGALEDGRPDVAPCYLHGALDAEVQLPWLTALGRAARRDRRKVILLSHHPGLDLDGAPLDPLWSQVVDALDGGPDIWYWGHVHAGAVLTPRKSRGVTVRGRCVGHGGVPYAPIERTPSLVWAEDARADDPDEPRRARNGFAVLRFTPEGLIEELRDEYGAVRWTERTRWDE